jgi:GNAT superfamily N-acetyltransferase
MRLSWEQAPRPGTALPAGVLVRQLTTTDEAAIGRLPLLAFALTDPSHQRRGIGQRLIEDAVARLASAGTHELHLAVTPGQSGRPALSADRLRNRGVAVSTRGRHPAKPPRAVPVARTPSGLAEPHTTAVP